MGHKKCNFFKMGKPLLQTLSGIQSSNFMFGLIFGPNLVQIWAQNTKKQTIFFSKLLIFYCFSCCCNKKFQETLPSLTTFTDFLKYLKFKFYIWTYFGVAIFNSEGKNGHKQHCKIIKFFHCFLGLFT